MIKLNKEERKFLDLAYQEAEIGLKEGGIPVGAVLVVGDKVVAKGHNKRIQEQSMIKHGETDCIENTHRKVSSTDLQRATLYTTLSPCYMCAGAILLNKIPRVIIGENKTFEQSEEWLKQNQTEIIVVNYAKCVTMMLTFIKKNLKLWGEDIGLTERQVLNKYKDRFHRI
ncbi:tRNA-specific adenosine deaminase [Candidatus Rickettsiella isopodorum]|jgi:cytosine deaminase|uniref:tRNA-specific adenosine deaminase n=1 Tax=Candidatus Rickettsiella isopodorum TaxID=1225476 RepID=A0A1J8PDQ8_9COXI|nr:nucleoside deaminase [Candidatus Rickettsiella isopodorum]OIZ95471.1 tRNA-specific adenosine deaminase [Candidatus Rickettsiella isopodorum]